MAENKALANAEKARKSEKPVGKVREIKPMPQNY